MYGNRVTVEITCVQERFDKTVDVFRSIRFSIVFGILCVFFWHVPGLGEVEGNTGFPIYVCRVLKKTVRRTRFYSQKISNVNVQLLCWLFIWFIMSIRRYCRHRRLCRWSRKIVFSEILQLRRKRTTSVDGGVHGGGDQGNLPDRLQFVPCRVVFL